MEDPTLLGTVSTNNNSTASITLLSSLSIYYQNARGINSKLVELFNSLLTCNFELIILTETWLTDSVANSEFCPDNFEIYRSDRKFNKTTLTRGGGVLIAMRKYFSVLLIDLSPHGFDELHLIDIVGVKLTYRYVSFYILVIYVPPKSSVDDYISLFNLLGNLADLWNDRVVIIGDFNIAEYHIGLENNIVGNNKLSALSTFLNLYNYFQFNTSQTVELSES